jgi:hypothetical protein
MQNRVGQEQFKCGELMQAGRELELYSPEDFRRGMPAARSRAVIQKMFGSFPFQLDKIK